MRRSIEENKRCEANRLIAFSILSLFYSETSKLTGQRPREDEREPQSERWRELDGKDHCGTRKKCKDVRNRKLSQVTREEKSEKSEPANGSTEAAVFFSSRFAAYCCHSRRRTAFGSLAFPLIFSMQ